MIYHKIKGENHKSSFKNSNKHLTKVSTHLELNIGRKEEKKKHTRNVGREEKHCNLSNAVGSLRVDVSKKESSPLGCCYAKIKTKGVEGFMY